MFKYIKFVEVPVKDQDRAISFYTEKLGFKVVKDAPYKEGWRWIELEIPGSETHILLDEQEEKPERDMPCLVIIADNVDATYQALIGQGVFFTRKPMQAPWNSNETFAQFRDSEGNGIVISSH